MKLKNIISYGTLAAVLVLPLFFQNCGIAFESMDNLDFNSTFSRYSSDLKSVGITCQNPALIVPSDSRRLSRLELINTMKALFGEALYLKVEPTVLSLANDEIQKDPRNFPLSFDTNQLEILDRVSRQMAILVTGNDETLKSIAGTCSVAATVTEDCVKTFINGFVKRGFRRPLTAEDVSFFQGLYKAAGAGKAGLGAVVTGVLISPEFLYHVEVGTPGAGSDIEFTLTDHEVASRVSYLLTDGPPDASLMAKADDGTLRENAVLSAEVDRLLTSAMGRDKVHRFFGYWLMLENFQGIPSSTNYLAGVDPNGLTTEMSRELYAFIDYVIFDQRGSYSDLLTSRKSFARTSALASIYGHQPVTGTAIANTDGSRMGLLLRSPVLANGTNQTHPILRGVFMLRRILCNDIPSPSPADLIERISANFVPDPLHDSTAVTTAKQTSSQSCMACHSSINPLGFALEGFDNLGRSRTNDRIFAADGTFIAEHPVQTSGPIYLGRSPASQITSAPELMSGLAGTVLGPACFTRQMHRFYKMQRETSDDGCVLSMGYGALQDPGGSIYAAIKASIVNAYTDKKRVQ
jgi:hypothetical protein